LIVGDVVDLELAGVDVAQYQGGAGDSDWGNAGELPIHADRADGGRAGDLIVAYVVDQELAGIGVAKDHIAFAGDAAENYQRPKNCQFRPTVPMKAELVI
jgi:hypothetical protein